VVATHASSDAAAACQFCCVGCGGRECRPVYAALPWLRQCTGCGLRCTWPQPAEEELAALYDAEYYRALGYDLLTVSGWPPAQQARADRLLGLAERHVGPGRLLDVGSGLGDVLAAGVRRGWRVTGIEPNGLAAGWAARRVPQAEVVCQSLEEFAGRKGTFDVVTCLEVIEHFRDPGACLERIRRLLRPGGILVATTPDAGSLHARVSGRRWVHYHRDHLWYFDRRILARLARRAGLEVLRCATAWKVFTPGYMMHVLARFSGNRAVRGAARAGLRWLPRWVLVRRLPPLPEGLLLLARRPAGEEVWP